MNAAQGGLHSGPPSSRSFFQSAPDFPRKMPPRVMTRLEVHGRSQEAVNQGPGAPSSRGQLLFPGSCSLAE